MLQRKHLLWILFFGSLIGLHEVITGSFSMSYRSVILNSVTLGLLSLARFKLPIRGSSLAIILIAIIFKMNNAGVQTCTTAWFLCGPTALLSLGAMYELAASLVTRKKDFDYQRVILACSLAALLGFVVFGAVTTFIVRDWDLSRFLEYIYIKAVLTAIVSSGISSLLFYFFNHSSHRKITLPGPSLFHGLIGFVIVAFWLIGTFIR
jgi:hypothetical protein